MLGVGVLSLGRIDLGQGRVWEGMQGGLWLGGWDLRASGA